MRCGLPASTGHKHLPHHHLFGSGRPTLGKNRILIFVSYLSEPSEPHPLVVSRSPRTSLGADDDPRNIYDASSLLCQFNQPGPAPNTKVSKCIMSGAVLDVLD